MEYKAGEVGLQKGCLPGKGLESLFPADTGALLSVVGTGYG